MPQKVNPKYVIPVAAQATQLRGCAVTALETDAPVMKVIRYPTKPLCCSGSGDTTGEFASDLPKP